MLARSAGCFGCFGLSFLQLLALGGLGDSILVFETLIGILIAVFNSLLCSVCFLFWKLQQMLKQRRCDCQSIAATHGKRSTLTI